MSGDQAEQESRSARRRACRHDIRAASLTVVLALGACATESPVLTPATADAGRRHADALVLEARAELASMREELAANRIAVAKKEAEVQDLRRQIAEAVHAADAKRIELVALKRERDQLLQIKNEYRVQLEEIPQLRQQAADAVAKEASLQGKVAGLERAVAELRDGLELRTVDYEHLKAAMSDVTTSEQDIEERLKQIEDRIATLMVAVMGEWQHADRVDERPETATSLDMDSAPATAPR